MPLSFRGAYPGLYLSTNPNRFIRPVKNISVPPEDGNVIELIGPFEQVIQSSEPLIHLRLCCYIIHTS